MNNTKNKFGVCAVGILAFVIGIFAVSFTANARMDTIQFGNPTQLNANYSCSNALYGTHGTYWGKLAGAGTTRTTYTDRTAYTYACSPNHTSNASGAVITASQTLRAATAQTVGLIANRINAVRTAALREENGLALTALSLSDDLKKGQIGLSGGNSKKGVGVWVQGRFSDIESTNASTNFDGDIYTILMGVDKSFKKGRFLIGLSAGYEEQDFDTAFNKGTMSGDGYIVAPYASLNIGKGFSLDATGGYANLDYDMTRGDPANGEVFTSTTDGDRIFAAGGLTYNEIVQKSKGILRYSYRAGVNYSREKKAGFTETGTTGTTVVVGSTSTNLKQATFGLETGFKFKRVEPFVRVNGEYDLSKSDAHKVAVSTTAFNKGSAQVAASDDSFGVRMGGGLNIWLGDRATAMIAGDTVYGRDNYQETSGTARFRLNF